MFKLHDMLEKDCISIAESDLNILLLMNTKHFPWFILVPKRESIKELFELNLDDQIQFNKESTFLSKSLSNIYSATKMNVAALGNMCPQLHVHHIVRFRVDSAWPNPVWGHAESIEYQDIELSALISKIGPKLSSFFKFS